MQELSKFKTTKAKQQTYSCYLDLKLDIFNIYMLKHTCMNYELSLKDIKLITIIPSFLTQKQKQLIILL
jgi:hypothetical protein